MFTVQAPPSPQPRTYSSIKNVNIYFHDNDDDGFRCARYFSNSLSLPGHRQITLLY